MTTTAIALVAGLSSGLLVSPSELATVLAEPTTVVLTVGDRPDDFEAGHIPGARFIRYNQVATDGGGLGSELPPVADLVAVFAAAGVSDRSRVVIYGAPVAASRVFFTLDYLGHSDVRLLNGGLAAWRAEGRPVETGAARPTARGVFTAKPKPEARAMADWISSRLNSATMALIDARPDNEFTGADGGMNGAHAAGHLPGAKQLVWTDLVSRTGQFLPDDRLAARMREAGAREKVPIVTYCMVGMRASVVYFVARHLGLDVRMYDGSIVDWSRRGLPVVSGRH